MGKWQRLRDTYQKAIALKPDTRRQLQQPRNDLAKLGKVDKHRALSKVTVT